MISRLGFICGSSAFAVLGAGAAGAKTADFKLKLEKLSLSVGASKPFTVLHVSDTHLTQATAAELLLASEKDRELHERRSKALTRNAKAFAASVDYAKEHGFRLVHTGDLIDYCSEGNIAAAKDGLSGMDALVCPGNHEIVGFPSSETPKSAETAAKLMTRLESAYGTRFLVSSQELNGVRFVAFDNGGLSKWRVKEQIATLEAELDKPAPMVILCHLPPYEETLLAELRRREKNGRQKPPHAYMMMNERINRMIAESTNVKAILCGHLHFSWRGSFNGRIPLCVAPANLSGYAVEVAFV